MNKLTFLWSLFYSEKGHIW